MLKNTRHRASAGFTLIELLVVIAIIGILVAVLLPSISTIRTKARYTDASAEFRSIETGLEAFRGESALGAGFPPSASDDTTQNPPFQRIANPRELTANVNMVATGAHLLVHALMGADSLGPPGFKDVDRNGFWSDDTFRGPGGAYEIKEDKIVHNRYGGAGGGYVDEKIRKRLVTLNDMEKEGRIAAMNKVSSTEETYNQPLFTDPWDRPILYYRGNPAARLMLGSRDGTTPGIYRQEDNALITGSTSPSHPGIDFGASTNSRGRLHEISNTERPDANPTTAAGDLLKDSFNDSFARFIWDDSIKALNQPVRKDSFLLISAGVDGRFGTTDDVTNWPRAEK